MDSTPILICYDDSEDARRAIHVAADVFGPRSAVVLVVEPVLTSAESYAVMASASTGADFEELNRRVGLERAEAGADIAVAAGLAATPRSALGDPIWEVILDVADEIGASAIVIGSHGLKGVRELVEGSVSHELVKHSSRPVLVVPPPHHRS